MNSTPRRGRGKAKKTLDLVDAAAAILEDIAPTSVRGVAYKLFTRGLIPSMEKRETDKVSRHLTWARKEGIVPWDQIVDEGREAASAGTWKDPERFAAAALRSFRRDRWESQPQRVEIWSEKSTVQGVLAPVLDTYGVTFRGFSGFNSTTVFHEIAVEPRDRPLVAGYTVDYDCSGLFMSEVDAPRRLLEYGAHVHIGGVCLPYDCIPDADWKVPGLRLEEWGDPADECLENDYIDLRRIALVNEDLEFLPHFDVRTKRGDTRFPWYVEHTGETARAWELDAMDPRDLRDRVEQAILANIADPAAWHRCGLAESAEQESLRLVMGRWSKLGLAPEYFEGEVAR